jgi:DNA-binding response OmpR family regulator
MIQNKIDLLVVDDEEFNRDILDELLTTEGYAVVHAADGEEAWSLLSSEPNKFSAVLLDRMMPRLDGMGLLKRIKKDGRFTYLPVIFQTAIDHPTDIAEGIKAGAFYYMVKPVNESLLYAIVRSAVSSFHMENELRAVLNQEQLLLAKLFERSDFHVQSMLEARALATMLSNYYPQPQRVNLGITELLVNAVEHGNLGISYTQKSGLLQNGGWEQEIERRLMLPENRQKKVSVKLERTAHELSLTITDQGAGFDFSKYLEISPERAFDPNGRGIAMSKWMSFDSVEYVGKGNQVITKVTI